MLAAAAARSGRCPSMRAIRTSSNEADSPAAQSCRRTSPSRCSTSAKRRRTISPTTILLTGRPTGCCFADRLSRRARRRKAGKAFCRGGIPRRACAFASATDAGAQRGRAAVAQSRAAALGGARPGHGGARGRASLRWVWLGRSIFDRSCYVSPAVLDKFHGGFAQPLTIDCVELRVALRAGIAVYPADGDTAKRFTPMRRRADGAKAGRPSLPLLRAH